MPWKKRSVGLPVHLVASLLVVSVFPTTTKAQSPPIDLQFLRGDVDGDGGTTFQDAVALTLFPAFDQPMPLDRSWTYAEGDLNHDGLVDSGDLEVILEEIGSGAAEPAIPPVDGVFMGTAPSGLLSDSSHSDLLNVDCYGFPDCSLQNVKIIDPFLPDPAIEGRHRKIWFFPNDGDCSNCDPASYLEPEIEVVPTLDGFDLVATWTHPDPVPDPTDPIIDWNPMNYGVIRIPFIKFGPQVYVRDFRRSSEERLVDVVASQSDENRPMRNLGVYPANKYVPGLSLRGLVAENQSVARLQSHWPDLNDNPKFEVAIAQDTSISLADWWAASANVQYSEPPGRPIPEEGEAGVFREYVMGVSVHYPVLEYELETQFFLEPVKVAVGNPAEYDSIYWNLTIEPNRRNRERGLDGFPDQNLPREHPLDGQITAGETREITIAVRFYRPYSVYADYNRNPAKLEPTHRGFFLNLFREYRRYFKRLYGDVQYERDARPVKRVDVGTRGSESSPTCLAPDAWGFTLTTQLAARLVDPLGDGWEALTASGATPPSRFELFESRGFRRLLAHGLSGNYCEPPHLNWPFRIVSRLEELSLWSTGDLRHPLIETMGKLGAWEKADAAREVGIWWGRSAQPSFPPPTLDPVLASPDNSPEEERLLDLTIGTPEREAALDEVEKLAGFGVSLLGLDQSTVLPEWDRYHWLQVLRHEPRASWVRKYATESYSPDFTHSLQPTYFQMTKASPPLLLPGGPHAMIDFLNQGAESWGAIGKKIPEVDALAEAEEAARKLARRGFTLHLSTGWDASGANHVPFDVDQDDDGALDGEFEADEAWRLTVPPDLQQP